MNTGGGLFAMAQVRYGVVPRTISSGPLGPLGPPRVLRTARNNSYGYVATARYTVQ
jgi:hypothetical protein